MLISLVSSYLFLYISLPSIFPFLLVSFFSRQDSFALVKLLKCKLPEFEQHELKLVLTFRQVHCMPIQNEMPSAELMSDGVRLAVAFLLSEISTIFGKGEGKKNMFWYGN
jgi:hypothetical protein